MSQIALRRFYTNSPDKFAQLCSILEQISEILGYSMCGREAKGLELNRRSPVHCALLAIVARPTTYPTFYMNSAHKFAQLCPILEQILEIPDYSMCGREAERVELNHRSPVHCAVLAIVARPPTYPKPSNLSSILCMRTDPKSYDSIGFFFERKSLFSVLTFCVCYTT